MTRNSSVPPTAHDLLDRVLEAQHARGDEARASAVAKQHERGKLTARERIARLCDPATFVETGRLVASAKDTAFNQDLSAPADGVITGSGRIEGRPAMLMASDFTALGGTIGAVGRQKVIRCARRAAEAGVPFVMLHDGGGHRIQDGQDARVFAQGTPLFDVLAKASGWIPVVSAVMGPAFAGPTNYSAMSDFTVMIRGKSALGMAGPAMVKAATGEEIAVEELGGATMHADSSGVVHLATADEDTCLESIRRYLSYLPGNAGQPAPIGAVDDPIERRDEDLLTLVPANLRSAYDVLKVIERIADRGSVFEIRPTYARNVVVCFARLGGRPVGIIANQPKVLAGMLTASACEKAAHFIAVCDAFGLPLIYLVDVPGSAIGSAAERSGLGRRSGRMLYELGNATVPRISVVLRKGYGGAFIMMNGGQPSFGADACLAWPTAEICAMSVEGAIDVAFRREYESAPDPAGRRAELAARMKADLGPLRAAEHFHIDDVIDPRDTRLRLIQVLDVAPPRRQGSPYPRYRSISPV